MYKLNIQLFGGNGQISSAGAGGNVSINVLSSTEMISMRGQAQSEVDSALAAFHNTNEKYYAGLQGLNVVELGKGRQQQVIGFYDPVTKEISFNKRYFNSKKMDAAYDGDVKAGFHPSRGNKSGLEAVAAHELGHGLTDVAAKNAGMSFDAFASRVCSDAAKKTGTKNVRMLGSKISGYAKQNAAETIAEAYADVYCNGKKARRESRAVMEEVNRYINIK